MSTFQKSILNPQLHELICTSLNLELYDNAVFYAEKLLCESKTEDVKYLLAKSYIGQGKFHQAYQILKDCHSQQNRYLFTLICIKLNKFIDAEKSLLQKFFTKKNENYDNVIPNGSAGYYLLGIVCEKLSRKNEAISAFKKSIEMDPFMWCSYEKLCKLEPNKIDNNKIFTELNPKILIFNKKFMEDNNINNDKNNISNDNNINNDILKSFNIKNDLKKVVNELNNNNNSLSKQINNNNSFNSIEINKYKNILDFNNNNNNNNNNVSNNSYLNSTPENNNNNNNNMTPEGHKDSSIDYSHINQNKNYMPVKNNNNNPFVFSSTPNHIHLDFNNSSSNYAKNLNSSNSNNNSLYNIINNNNNESLSGFNLTINNNNNSLDSSRINPFNINNSFNNVSFTPNHNNKNSNNNNNNNNNNINNNNKSISLFNANTFNNSNPINNNNNSYNNNFLNNIQLKDNNLLNNINISAEGEKNNNENEQNSNNNKFIDFINTSEIQKNEIKNSSFVLNSISNLNNNKNNKNNNNNNNNNKLTINNKITESSFPTICQLLKYYSEIVKKLSLYECKKCIELLNQLPSSHYNSNYTFTTLGRCYFEIGNYRECSKFFEKSISLNPSYLSGLEYYSSCLYQLKDQFQCCTLANKCIEQSQFSPETWIVLGNCFSLQKEHEIAIKFFNRATQINPNFAYAYTLAGHEYVENENYNLANQCYTTALNYDQRHFNAWWGLGNIHLKEQNFSEAIKYFRKALSINSKSAVLHFYLAKAYLQGRDISKALKYLQKAQEEDEKNPMVKYQIAIIYITKGKADEAISILKELDVKMPKEAPIHIALGDCYKLKHDYQKALEQYNFAIDLDPKDSNSAKSSIERLYADAGNENISLNK